VNEETIALSAPYDRELVHRVVAELNEQPHDVLVGLMLAVDHTFPQRVWLIATVDVAADQGSALLEQMKALPSCTLSHAMTIKRAFDLYQRGECNMMTFSGTGIDAVAFNTVWPATLVQLQ
jgi:hypothetical protein